MLHHISLSKFKIIKIKTKIKYKRKEKKKNKVKFTIYDFNNKYIIKGFQIFALKNFNYLYNKYTNEKSHYLLLFDYKLIFKN